MFITNGPCCTTGSPIGRPCSSRSSATASPAFTSATSTSARSSIAAWLGHARAGDAQPLALEEVEHPPGRGAGGGGQRPARAGRHPDRPDRDVGVRLARPTSRAAAAAARRRRNRSARRCSVTSVVRPASSLQRQARDRLRPEHREVRRRHLARRRQVEPDLEQLERIRRRRGRAAGTSRRGRCPCRRSATGRRRRRSARSRRANRSDRSGPCGRSSRSRSRGADGRESPAPRGRGTCASRPCRLKSWPRSRPASDASGPSWSLPVGIGVVVVDAEQERVDRLPGKAERLDPDDGLGGGGHGAPSQSTQVRARRRHSTCGPGRARLHSPPHFRKTRMSSTDARTALQLRSLVKKSGELEVSLAEVPIPEPGAGRGAGAARGGADQSVRPRPAVRGRRHDEGGRLGHARAAGRHRADPGRRDEGDGRRGSTQSMPVGNEGAGVVVAAGASPAAQALLGKTVAVLGGAMYAQYRGARRPSSACSCRKARRRPTAPPASSTR